MTDSSSTRSSVDGPLEGSDNSPAFLNASTSASPQTEIPEHRPLPPLPTQDDGDQTVNIESEDAADIEPGVYNTSFVLDDEEILIIYSGVHPTKFHRYHSPQAEMLRRRRSEAGFGAAAHDAVTPEIKPEDRDVSIDHHCSKYDNMSAPTPDRGRPLPTVPRGRPLPPIPAKRPLPAFPAAAKNVDTNVIAALDIRIASLRQSLLNAKTGTRNLQALSQVKDSLMQAQAEMIEAQGELLAWYRAVAE